MDLHGYAQAFDAAERDFEQAVEGYGLAFEEAESSPRAERVRTARACGCRCENGGASLVHGWISPACLACRTGERTATFFIDLRCTRNCYFCFNPNQDHFDYFQTHVRDIVSELEQAHAAGARFDCLAVTGGEPLLHQEQVVAFFRRAKELYPKVHARLYTSGDGLDAACLDALAAAGLDELRFSVKPAEGTERGAADQERTYARMQLAVDRIPDVMIEVPVMPGSFAEMQGLIRRADELGVRGVNLLELCFPLHNAPAFRERGFRLRRHPFEHLYDYWYGGGIPVAGSETEALRLIAFAARERLRVGVHYCSSDNKNTGQIFQQNAAFLASPAAREHPWLAPDANDRFLKCAKAFGGDVAPVLTWLDAAGEPYALDAEIPSVSLPLTCAAALRADVPQAALGVSACVAEEREPGTFYLREVDVRPLA